jgi:hypothetical protein
MREIYKKTIETLFTYTVNLSKMKLQTETLPQTYQNVMELLVQEELEKQLKQCSETLTQYINKVEIATYALNRLPALYASCEKGKNMQKLIAQKQYREEVKKAVRQGLAAIQRDPLRISTPLISENDEQYYTAITALRNLQSLLEEANLLDYKELTWDNLVSVVCHALAKTAWTGVAPQSSYRVPQSASDEEPTQIADWMDSRYLY